jgi:hypothetical protein
MGLDLLKLQMDWIQQKRVVGGMFPFPDPCILIQLSALSCADDGSCLFDLVVGFLSAQPKI